MRVRIVALGRNDAHYRPRNSKGFIGQTGRFEPMNYKGNGWYSGIFFPDNLDVLKYPNYIFHRVRVTEI
jgi:hypothetical protein